jgi:mannosyltransferase
MSWSARLESLRPAARQAALPCILLIGLGLRLYRLGAANLWWDEALAVWAVRKGLAGVTLWTASDVHPPLFFWSLWAWVQVAGESEFALRLLPAFYGVLTVAAVYGLGRLVGGRGVGGLAALLTALSRFHVWWSQELRMYVMSGLLGVLSLYLFLRWLRSMRPDAPATEADAGDRWLAGYTLCTLGALYTAYLSAAWVLVENFVMLGVLISRAGYRRGRLVGRWVRSQAVIGIGLGAWLVFSWERMSTWSVSEAVAPGFVARLYAILLTSGASVDIDRYLWTTILPFATLLLGTVLLARRAVLVRDRDQGLAITTLCLSVVVPPLMIYLSTLPRSLFYTPHLEARYFLPFAPTFWVLLAWALVAIRQRWKAGGTFLACAVIASWLIVLPGHYTNRQLRDDYQTMVRAIVSQAQPGDVVLLDSGSRYPLFLYQYDRLLAAQRPAFDTVAQNDAMLTQQDIDTWIESNGDRYGRFWLAEVDANLSDPDRLLRRTLDARFGADWSEGYGANALFLYAPGQVTPSLSDGYRPQNEATAEATALGLRGWETMEDTYTPDGPVWVTLYWDRAPADATRLQLLNERGVVVAGRSIGQNAGAILGRERVEIPVGTALPPGRYALRLLRQEGTSIRLRNVRIAGTPDLPAPAGASVTLDAALAVGIALDGYTVAGAPEKGVLVRHPGDELTVDLYWRSIGSTDVNWTVFTHLIGAAYNPASAGPLWGQHDAIPYDGQWPTTAWRMGDTGIDRHIIRIDAQAPEGDYTLSFGLYDGATGGRAKVSIEGSEAGDQIAAGTRIRIEAP